MVTGLAKKIGYDLREFKMLTMLAFTVHIVGFGKFDLRGLAASPREKIEEFWISYERWTRIQERDAALNNDQGFVLIVDFDGFSLGHYASSNGERYAFFSNQFLCVLHSYFTL